MPRTTYFVQECPTCGRNLQVRVEYLGRRVVCQHCNARFEASEPSSRGSQSDSSSSAIMQRAEQLLQSAAASGIGLPKDA